MATEVQRREIFSPPSQHLTIRDDDGARIQSTALLVVGAVAKHLRLVFAIPVLVVLVLVLPSYLFGRDYVAHSSFLPELGNPGTQRFAGLAAQLGVSLGSMSGGETLDSYVEIAQSRTVLSEVVQKTYQLPANGLFGGARTGTLIDFYHASAPTQAQRLQLAVKALQAHLVVQASQKSGIIRVDTKAPSRDLAEAVNRNILDAINAFNLSKRQTRASAEREFVSGRLENAKSEVDSAEAAVKNFLVSNRQYQGSPQLNLEYSRLQRRLDLLQQVYVGLAQSYEQARIEEVRNTPVITLVDRPEGSATVARSRRQLAMFGIASGLLLAVLVATALESLTKLRTRNADELSEIGSHLGPLARFLKPQS